MPFYQGNALVIGVGAYRFQPRRSLPTLAGNAEAVAQMLRDPRRCGYPTEQVAALTNVGATRTAVLDALDRLGAQLGEDDTLFFYYAGHGERGEDGMFYLSTYDTQWTGRRVVASCGLRQDELLQRLRAIGAPRAVLIFDLCHASTAPSDSAAPDGEETGLSLPADLATALLGTGGGRVIITACRDGQRAYYERGAPLTIFAQSLVEGLGGAGQSGQSETISVFDLYAALYRGVEGSVRAKYQLVQEPELTIPSGVGPLAVGLYRGGVPSVSPGAPEPPPAEPPGQAVRQVSADESHQVYEQASKGAGATGARGPLVNFGGQTGEVSFGDVAGGAIVKGSGGDTISVGDISGSVGVNVGQQAPPPMAQSQRATYFDNLDPDSGQVVTLERAVKEAALALKQAKGAGITPVAYDLERVVDDLEFALKSSGEESAPLRARILRRAQRDLDELARRHPPLHALHQLLLQVSLT